MPSPVFSRQRARVERHDPTDVVAEPDGDGALVARLRDRDPEALRDAYDAHGPLVHATALRLVSDHQLAEECTQDVFMTLWRSADTIDPTRARLTTWLYVVARNRAITLSRRRNARPALPFADVPDVGSAPDPADIAERGETARVVVDALAELPDEQRQVVSLAFFAGLSHGEIADRLGVPLGTVKGRARLALDRLRSSLGRQGLDGAGE